MRVARTHHGVGNLLTHGNTARRADIPLLRGGPPAAPSSCAETFTRRQPAGRAQRNPANVADVRRTPPRRTGVSHTRPRSMLRRCAGRAFPRGNTARRADVLFLSERLPSRPQYSRRLAEPAYRILCASPPLAGRRRAP